MNKVENHSRGISTPNLHFNNEGDQSGSCLAALPKTILNIIFERSEKNEIITLMLSCKKFYSYGLEVANKKQIKLITSIKEFIFKTGIKIDEIEKRLDNFTGPVDEQFKVAFQLDQLCNLKNNLRLFCLSISIRNKLVNFTELQNELSPVWECSTSDDKITRKFKERSKLEQAKITTDAVELTSDDIIDTLTTLRSVILSMPRICSSKIIQAIDTELSRPKIS